MYLQCTYECTEFIIVAVYYVIKTLFGMNSLHKQQYLSIVITNHSEITIVWYHTWRSLVLYTSAINIVTIILPCVSFFVLDRICKQDIDCKTEMLMGISFKDQDWSLKGQITCAGGSLTKMQLWKDSVWIRPMALVKEGDSISPVNFRLLRCLKL